MKKCIILLLFVFILTSITNITSLSLQNTTNILGSSLDFFNINGTQPFNIANRNLSYHIYNWSVQRGVPSTCTFTLQTSPDSITWTDVPNTSGSCVTGGSSTLLTFAANWIRFKPSVFTFTGATPWITVNYRGIVDTFSVPSNQTQVFDIRSYGGNCTSTLDNATAISTADTLAVAANGYLYLPPTNGGCRTNNVTISSKIAAGSGPIYINTGQTLTITTPPSYLGPIQLFKNACDGQGNLKFLNGGTLYAEWSGAVADNLTNSICGFRSAMRAAAQHSILQLQAGTYQIGTPYSLYSQMGCPEHYDSSLSVYNGGFLCFGGIPIINSYISIIGKGIGITKIVGKTVAFQGAGGEGYAPLIYVQGDYPTNTCLPVANCVLHGTILKDFTLEDRNDLQSGGFWGDYGSGASIRVLGVYDLTVDHVEFLNPTGNSALQVFGTGDSGANTDGKGPYIFTNNWIHSDGRSWNISATNANSVVFTAGNQYFCSFSPANIASLENSTISNNIVDCDFSTTGLETPNMQEVGRLGENVLFSDNFISDHGVATQFAANGAHACITVQNGKYVNITRNTCKFTATAAYGIRGGGEIPPGTMSGSQFTKVTNNLIDMGSIASNAPFTLGGGPSTGYTDNIDISGNLVTYASSCAISVVPANNRRMSFHDNILYRKIASDTSGFICADTGTLDALAYISIYNNTYKSDSGTVAPIRYSQSGVFNSSQIHLWNNTPTDIFNNDPQLGAIGIFGSGGTVANGASGTFNLTYTGAKVGDTITVLGLADLNATPKVYVNWPAGLTITGIVSSNDNVTLNIINNSGAGFFPNSPVPATGNGRIVFIGERK